MQQHCRGCVSAPPPSCFTQNEWRGERWKLLNALMRITFLIIRHRQGRSELWHYYTVSLSISLTSNWSYWHLSNAAFFHFHLFVPLKHRCTYCWRCMKISSKLAHETLITTSLLASVCILKQFPQQNSDTQKREIVQRNPTSWIRHL